MRDRIDDLPLLINVLLNRLSNESSPTSTLRFDSEALKLLRNYDWPGNVRELENIVERLALTVGNKGTISGPDVRSDLESNGLGAPNNYQESKSSPNALEEVIISRRLRCLIGNVESLDQCERQELEMYLRRVSDVGGNLAEAARQLKIKRTTLHMRIKRLRRKSA